MATISSDRLHEILACPRCQCPLNQLASRCSNTSCAFAFHGFLSVEGQAVLIDANDSIVDPTAIEVPKQTPPSKARKILNALSSKNPIAPKITAQLFSDLVAPPQPRRPLVLVVGGGKIGSGLDALYDHDWIDVVGFDVYPSSHTQFIADAHAMPLGYESVDAVIIQAVLEHVLEPERVVAEIYRVLKPNGLVYADTPFLQHVHEGPFDFTRFTESGHRWLFRRFELLESGFVAGAGTTLSWSVAQAIRSILPIRGIATAVQLFMRPLEIFFDRFGKPEQAIDGANSVYFYGRKSTETLKPRDMVQHYRGAQRRPTRVDA